MKFMQFINVIFIFIVIIMTSATIADAIDCKQAQKKLDMFYIFNTTKILGEKKYDEALAQTLDTINAQQCIKEFNKETINPISWAAGNLGSIYKEKGVGEAKAIERYNKLLGNIIKDKVLELYLFERFITFYTSTVSASYGGKARQEANICTFTTEWGTVYYGCDKVTRLSNSPLATVTKLNDLIMAKAILNSTYANFVFSDKVCPNTNEPPLYEGYYFVYPMMVRENYIMKMAEKAPVLTKKLIEKASKLDVDIDFESFVSTCKSP